MRVAAVELSFDTLAASKYSSATQRVRVMSETWLHEQMYCPACGNHALEKYPNNRPVSDFFCPACNEDYELKSKNGPVGAKLVDGAYDMMMRRLDGVDNPNLVVLSYAEANFSVVSLQVVPKQFFTPIAIERRPPLAQTARRAGWVGCNILLDRIAAAGRIAVVQDGRVLAKTQVLAAWRNALPFRELSNLWSRGWALEVLRVVEQLPEPEFALADIYDTSPAISARFPGNNNVRAKIRQQLQILRDKGFIQFLGKGRYRKLFAPHPADTLW